MAWTADELARVGSAEELRIAVERPDGSLREPVPVWVVVVGPAVLVRTWYRRDSGWYGRALRSRRARIAVPGAEAAVLVEDVGAAERAAVDAAYRAKYGGYGAATVDRMTGDDAAATTLRLVPDRS